MQEYATTQHRYFGRSMEIGHWMSQECGCDGILMQMVDATSLLFTCDKKWDDVVASTTECCDEFWLMAISKAIEGVEGGTGWWVMFEGRRVRAGWRQGFGRCKQGGNKSDDTK
jgi:hypothetical protein